ncbi:hypothetical protein [Pedobacter psychrodurus]|jgi:hypothetical protein|nr:hypothetical protein [Pedobacter psychrodurus]
MSRDKKKPIGVDKKAPSDYQSGKGKSAKVETDLFAKKPGKNGK